MSRLILILLLLVVIYWLGRSVFEDLSKLRSRQRSQKKPPSDSSSNLPVTDQLVQDPVCGVYCPKKKALSAIYKGKVYYFCSEECRQKFLAQKASSSSS